MKLIKDLMTREVISIESFKSVGSAIKLMLEKRIGGLPVTEDHTLIGIITSRDIRYHHRNRLVCDAMTKEVVTATPQNTIDDALRLMDKYHIERIPVIDENKRLIGMVTKKDLLPEIVPLKEEAPPSEVMGAEVEMEAGATFKELTKVIREKAEKDLILKALEKANWNKAQVARQLGIDYKTLYYKIKNYGIKKQKS